MHIDAEGSDWIILQQLDLAKYRPKAILVEHKHLDAEAKAKALAFLRDYTVSDLGDDFLCIRKRT